VVLAVAGFFGVFLVSVLICFFNNFSLKGVIVVVEVLGCSLFLKLVCLFCILVGVIFCVFVFSDLFVFLSCLGVEFSDCVYF
jgi:hypothetical protein